MKKSRLPAVVGALSKRAPPTPGNSISKFVHNATLSTQVNRKFWILPGASINSVANTGYNKTAANLVTIQKNALLGCFFYSGKCLLLAMSMGLSPLPAYAIQDQDACTAEHSDETARVSHVIDGDTVILADDRRVRLIGIDTPEIGYDGRPSDPGAIQARDFLDKILSMQHTVHLIYGHEHFDRHGRTLAHLFLTDNTNVQAALLNKGMATPLTIPPNLQFTDCYRQHAELAIRNRRGLWELPQYQPVPAEKLAGTERGYRIITGKVRRVTESRSSIWINLERRVALRIKRDDLVYFEGIQLHNLAGQQVQARGWVYHRNGELRMQLRHRVDLQMTGTIPGN